MLKRLAFFFALFLPAGAFAQVQYEIVSVPVCWNDSSLIKYTYVTTSGAYLDLGYFSPSGAPVTVSGGTLRTGFCPGQTLSIDSTANRTFTITLGDQTVSWVDSIGSGSGGGGITSLRLGELTDVDTTGEATGSIILYDATSGNWEAQANSIDNLTDGYYDANLNLFLGKQPSYIVPGNSIARFNVANGYFALDSIGTGYDNTAIGTSAMFNSRRGSFSNTVIGRGALGSSTHIFNFKNNYHEKSVAVGAFAGSYDTLSINSILIGVEAGFTSRLTAKIRSIYIGNYTQPIDTVSVDQIVIGSYAIPKGDSTVVIGSQFYKGTYLNGNLNLNGYGLGNKEATDLTKTRSRYIAAFATDGTLLELDTTGLYASGATTLNGLTDVVLTNPQINDVLKYNGTNWVNDTLTISGGGGVLSVTANNGLTNTGTASQPVISLGGTLTAATTTINANLKNLEINRAFNFDVDSVYLARIGTQDGLSTSSELRIGAAANTWQSVNNDDGLTNQVRLYSSSATQGVEISSYQNANNGVFTQIELLPQQMQIVTPNVNTLTATAGQVLKLVNASTGEVEFAADATGSATLSGLTDVNIGTPAAGEALIYNGTAWVNDTVINTLTATNGVRNAGSSASPEIRLGGALLENTTITGSGTYSLTIDNPGGFSAVNADLFELEAESTTRRNRVVGSQFSTVFMESRSLTGNNSGGVISASPDQIRLIHSNNTNTFTRIDIDTNAISLVTPNVRTNTATAGQVLKLVNASTGEVEFAADATGGGGFTLPTDSITFNDNNGDAVAGKLQYDTDYGTLVFGAQNNTPIHIGSDMGWYVKNQTGSPIAKGVPVYASGTDGASGRITVAPMIANNSVSAKFFLGVTAEAIANGADGFVWSQGKIRLLNLSAFTAGDVLYVSPTTAGTFTASVPTAPNLKLPVGFVVNNSATGTLAVRATIGNYLAEAHDVQLTTPSNGQVLKYDGTKWVNSTDLVNDADADPTNELQDLTLTGNTLSLSGDATTVDLSGYLDDQTVSLTGGGITAISGTYPNFTITSTEVDGSTSNEGALSASTVSAGSVARLTSNTNGGSNVDFSAGTGIVVGSSGGNTISITNTLPEATTASGGLTETGNNIALGGTLNSSTVLTLPTDGTFTIANTGGDGTGFTINEGIDATVFTGLIAGTDYGSGTREAGDISKTNSAYFARFATDGTVVESTALTSEVDGSVTNEGALSIGTGVAGSSVFIQSNTSGSTPVTISVGDGFDIAASGSTIFLNPEAYAIQSGTSGAISWGSAPQRIHVLDFGANTSITLSFTNVAVGGIYTLRVTGNSGTDTLIWPAAAKFEDGTSAGTVTLQNGGQMFTFYWDGTNYWVK